MKNHTSPFPYFDSVINRASYNVFCAIFLMWCSPCTTPDAVVMSCRRNKRICKSVLTLDK